MNPAVESRIEPSLKQRECFSVSTEFTSNRSSCCLFDSQEKICKLTLGCFQSPSNRASLHASTLSCLCLSVPSESVSVLTSPSYSVYFPPQTVGACKHHMMFIISGMSCLGRDHKVFYSLNINILVPTKTSYCHLILKSVVVCTLS